MSEPSRPHERSVGDRGQRLRRLGDRLPPRRGRYQVTGWSAAAAGSISPATERPLDLRLPQPEKWNGWVEFHLRKMAVATGPGWAAGA